MPTSPVLGGANELHTEKGKVPSLWSPGWARRQYLPDSNGDYNLPDLQRLRPG